MESAMDTRSAAAAAAAPLPLYPSALLSLPDLDRPPAIMEMWELEAVAAALPAKKRRLRDTFDRLAACSPTPLPFRWEDLDTYISSLQYSVTLRRRQLRELEKSKPAPALAPAPAATSLLLPVTGGGDVGQVRVLENPRPAPAPEAEPVLPAVSAPPATDGDVHGHELRALVTSKPVQPRPPAPAAPAAAVSAPAVTGVHVEEGRKRKASIQEQEAEEVHVAKRTTPTQQEGQAEMRSDAAVKKATSPTSHDINGKELRPVPQGDDDNGLAAEANASTGATVQVDAGPIYKTGGTRRHESSATMPRATNATSQSVSAPEQKQVAPPEYEVPDVETDMVQVQAEEMPQVLKEDDASLVAKKARQTQVNTMSEEADKVSPLPLCCSNGHAQAGAGAATAMPQVAAAAGATVRKSSPTVTRDSANLVQASAPAPKSAGGAPAATRDASATHATRRAPPPAAGSQQDASDVSSLAPPRGGSDGLAQPSRVSAGSATHTDSARRSALVRQGSPAAGAAPARRDLSATDLVAAASRRANAGKHVLQQQHMPKREPISSPRKQQEWSSSENHDGRPTGPRPVPEAQDDAAAQRSWSRPGEARGGGLAAARGIRGDDDNRNKDISFFKGKRPLFCDKCGCKGHLAENCRTAKHLVDLYQKAKEWKEKGKNQICYRCGCTGHWSRNCRTPKHLVDLYQKDRAAKRAAGLLQE